MVCPVYLAMTAAEFCNTDPLPHPLAWMACHFSPYAKGLSNIPNHLPQDSMLILNDRIPVDGHCPDQIVKELTDLVQRLDIKNLLLDLQRPENNLTRTIVEEIVATLPCTVGISHHYALEGQPVFVPPIPQDIPPEKYLQSWENHKIWLEIAADPLCLELTDEGCRIIEANQSFAATEHWEESLRCHYKIQTTEDRIRFLLYRKAQELDSFLTGLNIDCAIGLYQQFR